MKPGPVLLLISSGTDKTFLIIGLGFIAIAIVGGHIDWGFIKIKNKLNGLSRLVLGLLGLSIVAVLSVDRFHYAKPSISPKKNDDSLLNIIIKRRKDSIQQARIKISEDITKINHLISRGEYFQHLIAVQREAGDKMLQRWADSSKMWLKPEQVTQYNNCNQRFGGEQRTCLEMMISLLNERKMNFKSRII